MILLPRHARSDADLLGSISAAAPRSAASVLRSLPSRTCNEEDAPMEHCFDGTRAGKGNNSSGRGGGNGGAGGNSQTAGMGSTM